MKGDIPQAAFRLLCVLPHREHRAPEPVDPNPFKRQPDGLRLARKRNGFQGKTQKVQYKGVLYPSRIAAMNALHISHAKLLDYIKTGKMKVSRNESRPLKYQGFQYASRGEAMRQLHIGFNTLCNLIASGEAEEL